VCSKIGIEIIIKEVQAMKALTLARWRSAGSFLSWGGRPAAGALP